MDMTIYVRPEDVFDNAQAVNNYVDELFRVGEFRNLYNSFVPRNIVIMFDYLKPNNTKGYTAFRMPEGEADRIKLAESIKKVCSVRIKDSLTLKRTRQGYLEYIDDDALQFNDERVSDILDCADALKSKDAFTPICIVGHIDSKRDYPHFHVLYITHNVDLSRFAFLQHYVGEQELPEEEIDDSEFI